jgi:hypothetical protein
MDRVGEFNSRLGRTEISFPWSCEETELCLRARNLFPSGDLAFEPEAVV